jgi:hypothetical protein
MGLDSFGAAILTKCRSVPQIKRPGQRHISPPLRSPILPCLHLLDVFPMFVRPLVRALFLPPHTPLPSVSAIYMDRHRWGAWRYSIPEIRIQGRHRIILVVIHGRQRRCTATALVIPQDSFPMLPFKRFFS